MHGYIDLWTGLAGDMMVGALLDAGWPEEAMRDALARIPLPDARVTVEARIQQGIRGWGIRVEAARQPPERSYGEIRRMLAESALSPTIRERASSLFARLAAVEGRIHGVDPDDVHFHELGAIDSIADIVLCVAGLEGLAIDRLSCGHIPLSRGEVATAHGLLPAPAPATLLLLEGLPVRWIPIEGEWLTPTGALLLAGLVETFGDPPDIRLHRVGIGAGTRSCPGRANIVRLLVGEPPVAGAETIGWISIIESNLDDLDPRHEAEAVRRLEEAGALDVYRTPVLMKKGRRGTVLTVLARPEDEERLGSILLRETTTLGLRIRREFRRELERWTTRVETPYGTVRVKWAAPGGTARAMPEFEDVRARSREAGVPPWEVERAALQAARPTDPRDPPAPSPASGH